MTAERRVGGTLEMWYVEVLGNLLWTWKRMERGVVKGS